MKKLCVSATIIGILGWLYTVIVSFALRPNAVGEWLFCVVRGLFTGLYGSVAYGLLIIWVIAVRKIWKATYPALIPFALSGLLVGVIAYLMLVGIISYGVAPFTNFWVSIGALVYSLGIYLKANYDVNNYIFPPKH